MRLSTDRILTTHVGSLPRDPAVLEVLRAENSGVVVDRSRLGELLDTAVDDVVAAQIKNGLDIVNDGEASKISYTFYVRRCLSNVALKPAGSGAGAEGADYKEFPDFAARVAAARSGMAQQLDFPACIGPVAYCDEQPLKDDLRRLRNAVDSRKPFDAFVSAASPGVLVRFVRNEFYPNEDAYLDALAEAMRIEFEAIHAAGFVLQVDCPDLGSSRNNIYHHLTDAEFLKVAQRHIDVLNHATRNIPADDIRLHLCWGNYEGPHTTDIPLAYIAPIAFSANARAISFEAANPRHEHEWEDLLEIGVPDDKVLIPGMIDSTTNFVEHPRLIAQRLCNWAKVVGRDRLIAGADCGFATFAAMTPRVVPSIAWAKFRSLAEGAEIATRRLK
jgi:5-methyltetrahydropteroyltriglutamate--homocysteine methyltransferase